MSDEHTVIKFPGQFFGELSAEDVLRKIADEKPKNVFVIAWPENGKRPEFYSNTGDVPVIMLRLQQFIFKVLKGDFSGGMEP